MDCSIAIFFRHLHSHGLKLHTPLSQHILNLEVQLIPFRCHSGRQCGSFCHNRIIPVVSYDYLALGFLVEDSGNFHLIPNLVIAVELTDCHLIALPCAPKCVQRGVAGQYAEAANWSVKYYKLGKSVRCKGNGLHRFIQVRQKFRLAIMDPRHCKIIFICIYIVRHCRLKQQFLWRLGHQRGGFSRHKLQCDICAFIRHSHFSQICIACKCTLHHCLFSGAQVRRFHRHHQTASILDSASSQPGCFGCFLIAHGKQCRCI